MLLILKQCTNIVFCLCSQWHTCHYTPPSSDYSLSKLNSLTSQNSLIILHMHTKTYSNTSCCQPAKSSFLPHSSLMGTLPLLSPSRPLSQTLPPPILPSLYLLRSSLLPLRAVSLLWSPLSKFTALISPETCIASRCARPAAALGPVGWGVKGRSD